MRTQLGKSADIPSTIHSAVVPWLEKFVGAGNPTLAVTPVLRFSIEAKPHAGSTAQTKTVTRSPGLIGKLVMRTAGAGNHSNQA